MRNKLIKATTLVLFSTLIIGFVSYRSGYFGRQRDAYSLSENESASISESDTIPKVDSLKRIELMSSSKVLILRNHSVQGKDSDNAIFDSTLKISPLIYSSKSGIILNPEDLNNLEPDSIVSDSLKN